MALETSKLSSYGHYLDKRDDLVERGFCVTYVARAMPRLSNCKMIILNDAYSPWGPARLEKSIGIQLEKGLVRGSVESKEFLKRA
jgi:hypothetical protein